MRFSSLEVSCFSFVRKTSRFQAPWSMVPLLSICLAPSTILAQSAAQEVPVGKSPDAIAVNPTTNNIYVANYADDTITVIDGVTGEPVFLPGGAGPFAIAINAVTDKIYVADALGVTVTVIDGKTNAISYVLVGRTPKAIAVNPITNKIYVASVESGTVTVIDGVTHATTSLASGVTPRAIAVNTVTNRIYVANYTSNSLTVIDGATNATSTIAVGTHPDAVAVNPVTNSIYVANFGSGTVTVIDGATASTTTIAAASGPYAVAVNPVSNKIYVANYEDSRVTVIDGATNTPTSTIRTDPNPSSIAVNTLTNQVYVAQESGDSLYVIDGASGAASSVSIGSPGLGVAVNPITNKIYVANQGANTFGTNNVAVLDGNTAATYAVNTIPLAYPTDAVALDPVTNKIYLDEFGFNSDGGVVSVIDGATHAISSIFEGLNPISVAVNPVTNTTYISYSGNDPNHFHPLVAVIDGATGSTTALLPITGNGSPLQVNPVTNKVYLPDGTVIDGATDAITSLPLTQAPNPYFNQNPFVIDQATNKIYTVTYDENSVADLTIIDGSTNAVAYVPLSESPDYLAVDTVTNNIILASSDGISQKTLLTVVDGATHALSTYQTDAVGFGGLAVNQFTGNVYFVADDYGYEDLITFNEATTSHTVTKTTNLFGRYSPDPIAVDPVDNRIIIGNAIIDGVTNSITYISDLPLVNGDLSRLTTVAVNPIDQSIYFSGDTVNNIEGVITPLRLPNPLNAFVTPLTGNVTSNASPTFNFTTTSTFAPVNPPVQGVYYQLDTKQGLWLLATGAAPNFSGMLSSVALGTHVLYFYAANGSESTDAAIGGNSIGAISAYAFTVVNP